MKKDFTQLQQIQESGSDLSYDENEEENLHFQIADRGFQFTQLNQEFEPHIAKVFNPAPDFSNKLDLREITPLESQYKMDLFCNQALVTETLKSSISMRFNINCGTMVVTHKANMAGYHKKIGSARETSPKLLLWATSYRNIGYTMIVRTICS